jgi:hypothetical protein
VANPRIALGLRKNKRIRSGEDRNEKEGFNWERGLGVVEEVMMEQVFYTRNGALKQESDDEAFSFILR